MAGDVVRMARYIERPGDLSWRALDDTYRSERIDKLRRRAGVQYKGRRCECVSSSCDRRTLMVAHIGKVAGVWAPVDPFQDASSGWILGGGRADG